MKKIAILLLCFIALWSYTALAVGAPKKYAKRYKRQLQLQDAEVYYVSLKDLIAHHGSSAGKVDFPCNPMYNIDGAQMKMQTPKGAIYQTLTCFETFKEDVDTIFSPSSIYSQVMVKDKDAQWEQQHVQPVYVSGIAPLNSTNIFVYYPAGMPFVKGKYRDLIAGVRHYQQQGQKINLYFVIVEVFNKESRS